VSAPCGKTATNRGDPDGADEHRSISRQDAEGSDAGIHIVEFPATPVAILAHRGDPTLIGDTVRRFIAWRKTNHLPPKYSATFNILYDNPDTTPPADFRLDLCATTDRPVAPNDAGIVDGVIPAGRCAVLRLTGSSDALGPAIATLFGEWLPRSGEELRHAPVFAQRVRFFPDVPEHEAVTDIFLPLL
jgi:AraC family transcriptional regulator